MMSENPKIDVSVAYLKAKEKIESEQSESEAKQRINRLSEQIKLATGDPDANKNISEQIFAEIQETLLEYTKRETQTSAMESSMNIKREIKQKRFASRFLP